MPPLSSARRRLVGLIGLGLPFGLDGSWIILGERLQESQGMCIKRTSLYPASRARAISRLRY